MTNARDFIDEGKDPPSYTRSILAGIEHLAAVVRSAAGELEDLVVGCLVGAIGVALRLSPAANDATR